MSEYNFKKFPPANLFIQLLKKKFTGMLHAESGDDSILLFFSEGYPVKGLKNNNETDVESCVTDLFDQKWGIFSLKPSSSVDGKRVVPFNAIKEGVKKHYDKSRLLNESKELIGKKLALKKGFKDFIKFLTFNENESAVLTFLQGEPVGINEIADKASVPVASVLAFVYSLASLGIIYAPDKTSAATEKNEKNLDPYISELLENLEHARKENYFLRMQLSFNASMDKVNQRFKEFAKKFHPDVVVNKGYAEYREQAEEFFRLITEALNGLKDPDERDKHRNSENVSKEDKEEVKNILEAEMHYQQALIFFHRKEYAEAEKLLREAIKKAPDDGGYIGLWAWVSYLNPAHDRAAIRDNIKTALKKAIELTPREANLYFYLGKVLADANQIGSAKQYLAKTLELNPNHLEAARILRLLERRKSQTNSFLASTGSFINNFFKKK